MKILTLNTWQERGPWRDRWKIILKGLKEHAPDIVGFQEVFNSSWAYEIQAQAGYPYLVFPKEPSGLLFLSRFPVVSWKCLTLKTQSPTEDYLRYGLWMEVLWQERSLSCFNTHLSWRIPEGQIRENQVGELVSFIQEKAGYHPSLVMGDLTHLRKLLR